MRFVAIADTHGRHEKLVLPPGDVLLHAGDISNRGKEKEVRKFLKWFARQDYRHKIFIAGNHDFYFEQHPVSAIRPLIPEGVTYLQESGVWIDGLYLWGSPITPWYHDWAFNRARGTEIQRHWALIPDKVDLLLVHGPAYRNLDKTIGEEHVGCKDLLDRLLEVKPRYFVCGHIHESYGTEEMHGIRFINASVADVRYNLVNPPVVFDW